LSPSFGEFLSQKAIALSASLVHSASDVKKEGPSVHLPIAVDLTAANEQLATDQPNIFIMVGELAFTGATPPVGFLPPHHSSPPILDFIAF
jgi:predicted ATPase with chaperone activity